MMEQRSRIIIAGSVVLIVGLVLGWVFVSSGKDETPQITEVTEPSLIQKATELTHLSIATSENFARQKIYVISAYLKNTGDKPIRMAETSMRFTDFDEKTIHEYSQKILNPAQTPLAPGEQMRFEVRQENLPRGWNYRVPDTEISKIGY
jgi:Flp pilus assembly protein TadD